MLSLALVIRLKRGGVSKTVGKKEGMRGERGRGRGAAKQCRRSGGCVSRRDSNHQIDRQKKKKKGKSGHRRGANGGEEGGGVRRQGPRGRTGWNRNERVD